MSKAFKCNYCDTLFEGDCVMQVKANVIGIKYSPESAEASFYFHDLCEDCRLVFIKKYSEGKDEQIEKRKHERYSNGN